MNADVEDSGTLCRTECGMPGERVPGDEMFYGIHTLRATENFPITGVLISHYPELIKALAMVKSASAAANFELGVLKGESRSDHRRVPSHR